MTNDMILRGDALAAVTAQAADCNSSWGSVADAIRAIPAVTAGEPTDAQTASVCLSYRHDFGLMGADEQRRLMFTAREWLRAWQKEMAPLEPQPVQPAVDADLLLDAYKGLLVLHRMLDKAGLVAGVRATNNITDRIVAAHPEFPGLAALRGTVTPQPVQPSTDAQAIREAALREAADVAGGVDVSGTLAPKAKIVAAILAVIQKGATHD